MQSQPVELHLNFGDQLNAWGLCLGCQFLHMSGGLILIVADLQVWEC